MIDLGVLRGMEPESRIVGRNRTKADVLFYRVDGRGIAVKDYRPRPWWIRHTLGRWLVRRESAAYGASAGVAGVAVFIGRLGPCTLATERFPGEPLSRRRREGVEPDVFERLDRILDRLHARGVALGDLHHRDVLLADDGSLCVVDLAAAWVRGERPSAWRRRVFERLCDQDRVAAARMRARFTGGDPAAAVEAVGGRAARWHRRGVWVKSRLDRLRGRHRR